MSSRQTIKLTEKDISKIVTETVRKVLTQNIIKEEEMDKDDVIDLVKKNREIEQRIKEVAAEVMTNLFQLLWQQKNYFKGNIVR